MQGVEATVSRWHGGGLERRTNDKVPFVGPLKGDNASSLTTSSSFEGILALEVPPISELPPSVNQGFAVRAPIDYKMAVGPDEKRLSEKTPWR